jgi:hypothetical protein
MPRRSAGAGAQVSDRWHLWHGLGAAVEKTVIAHGTCWRAQPPQQPSQPSGPARSTQDAMSFPGDAAHGHHASHQEQVHG